MSTLYFFLGLFLGCSLSGTHLFLFHLIVIYYVNVCMYVCTQTCMYIRECAVCSMSLCVVHLAIAMCVLIKYVLVHLLVCTHNIHVMYVYTCLYPYISATNAF
jgi:hypothetical protein